MIQLAFADALQQGASQFEQQAGKLKRKFWLQNLKVSVKFYKRNIYDSNRNLNISNNSPVCLF